MPLRIRMPSLGGGALPPTPTPSNLYGVFDSQLVSDCWFDAQMRPEAWFLEDLITLIAALNFLRLGTSTPTPLYLGSSAVSKVYLGSNLVYSST